MFPFERLVELTGWESNLVREGLEQAVPEPWSLLVWRRLGPRPRGRSGAATFDTTTRLHGLTQRVLADLDDEAWSPAPANLDDLSDRLETVWRSWRQALGRRGT